MIPFNHEQERLLSLLVEASRNVPDEKRSAFIAVRSFGGETLQHPGLPGGRAPLKWQNLDTLARHGMVTVHASDRFMSRFTVSPSGIEYYARMRGTDPGGQIEDEIHSYLDSRDFRKRHPAAFDYWSRAAGALALGDTDLHYAEIVNDCRLAMQEFADSVLRFYPTQNAPSDKSKTVDRLRALLHSRRGSSNEKVLALLDALVVYWGAVFDLSQRQEQRIQKDGGSLVWRDSRRLVFQTGIVMFEVSHELWTTSVRGR